MATASTTRKTKAPTRKRRATTTRNVFPDVGTRAPVSNDAPLPWTWLQNEFAAGRRTLSAVFTHLTSRARGPRWLRTRVAPSPSVAATPAYVWKRALLLQQAQTEPPPTKFRPVWEAFFGGTPAPVRSAMTFYGAKERRGGHKARPLRRVHFSDTEHSDDALVEARVTRRLPSDRFALLRILEDANCKPLGADAMTDGELLRLAARLASSAASPSEAAMASAARASTKLKKIRRATPYRQRLTKKK